jgi:hypothetical protein
MVVSCIFSKWYNPAIAVSVLIKPPAYTNSHKRHFNRQDLQDKNNRYTLKNPVNPVKYLFFLCQSCVNLVVKTGQGRPNQYHNRFFIGVMPQLFTLPTDTKCHPETRSVDGAMRHQRSEGSLVRFFASLRMTNCIQIYVEEKYA